MIHSVLKSPEGEHKPVLLWTSAVDVESQALDQLKRLGSMPFVFKHVAAMPDVHVGKGATVGSVVATKEAVVPAAVGVDIGCGMMAVRTGLNADVVRENAKFIRRSIERVVPVGREGNKNLTAAVRKWKGWEQWKDTSGEQYTSLFHKAQEQLGSLGGGNHFIEVCLDEDENVWIMLHSGSRNVGKTLADIHISKAKGVMKQMFINLPDPDLAYFAQGTDAYESYMRDLKWCQDYAFQNRVEMMERIKNILAEILNDREPISTDLEVNCHHNYAEMENHYGENVLVTRKGAVRAREGDMGIIPGSMGARSYIVEGLGNAESFHSCAHGAGRRMSRSQAKKTISREEFLSQIEGVECRNDENVLDEAPGAYKNIDAVMANQQDLVRTIAVLKQVVCVKG